MADNDIRESFPVVKADNSNETSMTSASGIASDSIIFFAEINSKDF
jgi:hypothetical protein